MSIFNVDFDVLVEQLLPVRLRQVIQIAWLKCLVSPVKYVYNIFYGNRAANLYNLANDGQVCYLEAVLNDTFDPVSRGIYISDGVYVDATFVYLVTELSPVFIDLESEIGSAVIPNPDPVPLYLDSEIYTGVGGVTFIVNVPITVTFDMARLKALVDLYRLPGRIYSVIMY